MRALLAAVLIVISTFASPVRAQEAQVFVQIEAHPNLRVAEGRARAYGDILTDINGFRIGGGWYALTLGPYSPEDARARLQQLRRDGLIPRDSYVSDGGAYRDRFWPVGVTMPAQAAATAGDETAEAGTEAASTETDAGTEAEVEVVVAPEPVEPPEETPREARRSENLLTRDEKKDLQRALQWFDYYTAAIDGSYGRGTRNSMAAWQQDAGVDVTGVLTTRQRARLMEEYRAAQAALGLEPLTQTEAGVSMVAPLGLVAFDRIEAPFVHYTEKDGSGMQLSVISQPGDRATLAGLYEILQTLDIIPPEGERSKARDSFRIRGEEPGRTTEVSVKLEDGHIFGYLLSWPPEQETSAARGIASMDETLERVGAPLDPDLGFDPATQSFDMVSGLEVRQPVRSASGFFVDGQGRVATAAATVEGCGRISLDRLHDAVVEYTDAGVAVLRPTGRLAPVEVARLAPSEGRLRSQVSVGGFPFGGVLGAATLSFGTLEDVRGLDGSEDVLRLSLNAQPGDTGGPVLDASGRVTGILMPGMDDAARALPDDVAFAVKASTLARVLSEAGVASTVADTGGVIAPEDLTTRVVGMTVLVSCWE